MTPEWFPPAARSTPFNSAAKLFWAPSLCALYPPRSPSLPGPALAPALPPAPTAPLPPPRLTRSAMKSATNCATAASPISAAVRGPQSYSQATSLSSPPPPTYCVAPPPRPQPRFCDVLSPPPMCVWPRILGVAAR